MSSVLLGVLAACGASTLYNVGLALQAVDARASTARPGASPGLLLGLLRRPRWLAGTALNLLGFPLQALALGLAPLTVVQPALAFGLLILLVVGVAHLGERVALPEVVAVAGVALGVGVLAAGAPRLEVGYAGGIATLLVLASLAAVATAALASRRGGPLALGAGAALAASAITTKLAVDAFRLGHAPSGLGWLAVTGLTSGVGLLAEMGALRQRPATRVAPVVFVVQVLVPVASAPLLVGEHWPHPIRVVLGSAMVLAAAAVLLRSPAVARATDGGASAADSDVASSPAC